MKTAFAIVTATVILASGCSHTQYLATEDHLGKIETPCWGKTTATCGIAQDLARIETECVDIDKECDAGQQLLKRLFGTTQHTKFANYIVYFDQSAAPGRFAYHRPVLMWNRQNTRYLYGVQEVYILVLTEYKACLSAHLTTLAKNETNPFDALLKVLNKVVSTTDSQPSLKTQPAQFTWFPLSGDAEQPVMWLAVAPVSVDINTTDWITVRYQQPTKPKSDKVELPEECVAGEGTPRVMYKAPFLAHNAFFSDNRETRFAVSVGVGATFTGRHAGPTGSGSPSVNGYALGKFYPLARFRPTLVSDPNSTGGAIKSRRSFGLILGTNVIGGNAFDELVAGASLGHIAGNVGLIGGINFFTPKSSDTSTSTKADTSTRRQHRLFFGVEYSF
ncbi:MAG TPA: hypothetical protein VJZ76_22610 [Thermoanaerobaculia bacterium]|nr:hypothetical protein [Thermoanaerobaculia bacterium]